MHPTQLIDKSECIQWCKAELARYSYSSVWTLYGGVFFGLLLLLLAETMATNEPILQKYLGQQSQETYDKIVLGTYKTGFYLILLTALYNIIIMI